MAQTIFKGFKLMAQAAFTAESFTPEAGYLYFVRTNDGKEDGFLYFNGKKYGTGKDVESTIKTILGDEFTGTNVKEYVDAIKTELQGKIDTLNGSSHTHENKTVLDGITTEKVAAWDSAEANAKKDTADKIAALDAEVSGTSNGVEVTVKETDGKLESVTVTAPDFDATYEKAGAAAQALIDAKADATAKIEALDASVTGTSNGIEITVTEANGKLTAATASLKLKEDVDNIIKADTDGLFAAIYYEDSDV